MQEEALRLSSQKNWKIPEVVKVNNDRKFFQKFLKFQKMSKTCPKVKQVIDSKGKMFGILMNFVLRSFYKKLKILCKGSILRLCVHLLY
jgi:hypothetical protein